MFNFTDIHKNVLKLYARPIVHMRKQVSLNRFGLIFGAGLSKPFGIPNWGELVNNIADDPEVKGKEILTMSAPHTALTYKTEMLFEHFKRNQYKQHPDNEHHTRKLDYLVASKWREIVRKHLYAGIKEPVNIALTNHPYLNEYIPLIKKSYLTVSYNFDDFIEQSILAKRNEEERDSLGYESVTNPWAQFRRTTSIIYHPNGVIPQKALETPSDRFVFSEASYAEQLMGIYIGDQTSLINHFSKHTCLLIGLSLEDETLRNVLLQNAKSCPGNYHYYVYYMGAGKTLDEDKRRAIVNANFKVYNLITLFMNDHEICSLGQLLDVKNCSDDTLCDYAQEHEIKVQYKYYLTGSLGVGKSTAINHFRNLRALDEWLEPRPEILSKDWEKLTPEEQTAADNWILTQFRCKNDILRNEKEGIYILDRGPLDPLAFTPDKEWCIKAGKLLATICPGQSKWTVEDGTVILLKGDPKELALRMVMSQRKDYTEEKLDRMQTRLEEAYTKSKVIEIDTKGLTSANVARRIGEIIHLEEYANRGDLHNRLVEIRNNGGK